MEIMIVIAIIGILVWVLYPSMKNYLERAHNSARITSTRAVIANITGKYEFPLAAYFPFEENNWTTTYDRANSDSNTPGIGTLMNNPTWVVWNIWKAISFDGIDDNISDAGVWLANVGDNGNVTISAWINPTNISGTQTVFNKWLSWNCFNYGLVIVNGILSARTTSNDYALVGSVNPGVWSHVVIVFNGSSGAKWYINWNLAGTNASGWTTNCASLSWAIGQRAGWAWEFFTGSIDDLQIYKRILTDQEILDIYNAGK